PYPDRLLEDVASNDEEPDAEVVAKETIELAFIATIQLLPPKQRAVLISRDVLGWSAAECAALLDTSVAAVNSALQRARATLKRHLPRRRLEWTTASEPSEQERRLLERYMEATEGGDAKAMVRLLRADAFCAMPPDPTWWVGNWEIVDAWVRGGFGDDDWGTLRCVATSTNQQPAVACYVRRAGDTVYRPLAVDVLRIEDGVVGEITVFSLDEKLLEALGLPPTL
ncbi:MAG: RNA polymerase subunit sigma-70, partial [Gaiellaceae bacterium]